MEAMKRRQWLTRVLAALGVLSLGLGALEVQAAEKPVAINARAGTTNPDRVSISISAQDSVMWVCGTHEFQIVEFRDSNGNVVNPFWRPTPFDSSGHKRVSSGPAREGMLGTYKVRIVLDNGKVIDPHIDITP